MLPVLSGGGAFGSGLPTQLDRVGPRVDDLRDPRGWIGTTVYNKLENCFVGSDGVGGRDPPLAGVPDLCAVNPQNSKVIHQLKVDRSPMIQSLVGESELP